ncbi:hypothetical protein [Mastigocoleus sp. MO_188.B34]|uniref:hypothetical protein n=1 Tax=Mastigocoleus sp. MO_188.B34 TaxID=3036635 RepID=UPI00262D7A8C|nr:hypothetical protein [Mastigocoleus sp. MO_188.B34]
MTVCVAAEAKPAKRASFQGLGDLPSGIFSSIALDVSADGSTVVGSSAVKVEPCCGEAEDTEEAFRWTQEGGMQRLGDLPGGIFSSTATKVSADGSIVVGSSSSFGFRGYPFRWTQKNGIEQLRDTAFRGESYFVSGLSADGSIVVGIKRGAAVGPDLFRWTQKNGEEIILGSGVDPIYPPGLSANGSVIAVYYYNQAVRVNQKGKIKKLGDLPGGKSFSAVTAISANSSTIVGVSGSTNGDEAFRWRRKRGMQGLGDLPGGKFYSIANDVSRNGSIVVGSSESANGREAFIWNRKKGMRSLQEILTNEFAIDLTGWKLEEATAISDNGLTIVGNGKNPDGNQEAWIVRLREIDDDGNEIDDDENEIDDDENEIDDDKNEID